MFFKRFLTTLVTLAVAYTSVASAGSCANPRVRKEWRSLSILQKANYILALQCMYLKPGVKKNLANNYGARNRWEDYVAEHKEQTPYVHWVGHFLAWHRLFIWDFETTMREECGYLGAQPYWDFRIDAGAANITAESPVFDTLLGFGTNGRYDPNAPLPPGAPNLGAGGCIYNGPFAWWTIGVDQSMAVPMTTVPANPPGCIRRNINQQFTQMWYSPGKEEEILSGATFEQFDINLQGTAPAPATMGLHLSGHATIGGSNSIPATANADPLFYLHHTNLDRVWAKWQAANPATRQFATGGPKNPRIYQVYQGPFIPGNATLDMQIHLGVMNPGVQIGQIQDTRGLNEAVPGLASSKKGILCYRYEE